MNNLDLKLSSRDGGCHSRIHIPHNYYAIWLFMQEHFFEFNHHTARLFRMATGTNVQINIGARDVQLIKENARKLGIIMLPCVDQPLCKTTLLRHGGNDWSHFHEIWSGSNNM